MKHCALPGPTRLLLCTGLALWVSFSAWATDPKSARFYEDALVRFEKRDYPGAILQLKNALQVDRKQLPVQVLLGRALLAHGEVVAAEVAFEEALRLGVNPAEVVVPLAQAVSAQGRPQDLLAQPRFAHAGLPPAIRLRVLLIKAAAASDLGNEREALRLVEEARALDPNSAETWLAEVPIRVRARQLAEARAAASRAVAIDPRSADASYQLATVLHVSGDLRAAMAQYSRTLELAPEHVDALVARAGIHLDVGNAAAAAADVAVVRKSAARDPRAAYLSALVAERAQDTQLVRKELAEVTNLLDPFPVEFYKFRPQLLMLGGLAHYGLRQAEKARPYLELAQRQDPTSPVSKLLASIYLQDKNVNRAVELLELYLRAHPGDTQASLLLASAQMSLGRHGRAAQLMEEALKRTDDPAARSLLGSSLIGAGQFGRASSELEAVLKRDPGQVQAGTSLTGLYLASGQVDKAIALAEGLTKRVPTHPGLHNLLGSARAAKGDVAGAREAFSQAERLAPGFLEPQLNLARLDIDVKAYESARKRLEAILAKDERHVEASMEMARLFSGLGRPEEAQRWLERAVDHSGPRLQAGLQLVEFHLARRRPDLAAEALKRIQNKAPEALVVLLAQANVQLAAGDRTAAVATLTRASTLVGYNAAALVRIGEMQLRAGNVPGAAHALDKALAERPTHLQGRALMAEVDMHRGDLAQAEQRARGIVASHPSLGLGHALLGDVARLRGQTAVAIEAYRRAHQMERSSRSLLRLFDVLAGSERRGAVSLAEQWLKEHPTDATVRRALADLHARAGDLAAARTAYERLVQQLPRDAEALNNLANVLILLKDPGALAIAERAQAERPDVPHILGTLGWAAYHAGQTDRALQLLRDARLRDPQNADTRYFLGTVLARRGRAAEARQELEDALRGGQAFAHARDAQALLATLK